MKFKIKKKIKHQNIGGKEFIVDELVTKNLSPKEVLNNATDGNIACINFINRREDFPVITNFDETLYGFLFKHKLYYGHVNGLGYVMAEDEFETDENGKIIEV